MTNSAQLRSNEPDFWRIRGVIRPSQRFQDIPSQLVSMGGKAPLPFSGVLQNSAHMPLGDLVLRFEIAVDV